MSFKSSLEALLKLVVDRTSPAQQTSDQVFTPTGADWYTTFVSPIDGFATMYFIGMVQSVHFSNEQITRGFLALPWDSQLGAIYSQYTLAVRKGEVLRIGVHVYQSGSATVYFAPRVGSS